MYVFDSAVGGTTLGIETRWTTMKRVTAQVAIRERWQVADAFRRTGKAVVASMEDEETLQVAERVGDSTGKLITR